jgi:arylsulfatase A-like enzyme
VAQIGAGVIGASLFAALYLLVAAQQLTRYANPAGMSLTMAGIVPREAVAILVRALWPELLTTNVVLFLFNVAAGFALGALAGRFWQAAFRRAGRRLPRPGEWGLTALSLLTVALLAFATVAVRYPFQYDHLLNAQGGWPRRLQAALTGHVPPGALEAAMWALIALLALPTLARVTARRPVVAAALLIPALGAAVWHPAPSTAGANAGPNVVLILLESARSDVLSVNGFPASTTPNLQRLMTDNGVTFTNAWAHINGTVAGVVTMMTSTYSHRHGIRSMFHSEDFARRGLPRLPEVLRAHGFATRVVADWDGDTTYFNPRVLPGFDRYDVAEFGMVNYVRQIYSQHFLFYALTDNRLGHRAFSTFYRAGGGYAPGGGDDYYRARIASHLAELAGTRRFFLTLFFADPHFNYRCPYPYYRRFTDPAYEGPSKYQAMSNPEIEPTAGREGEAGQIRGLYAGCVSELDDNIGFVADTLRRFGLDGHTTLIIVGDHGERLPGDRKSFRYGRNGAWLDPEQFHVPLVIINPPVPVARAVVPATARHLDLMPTILELVGLPAPPGLEGRSLVPLITGAESDREVDVLGETGFHWVPAGPPYLAYLPMTQVVSFRLDARGALIPRYFLRADCLPRVDLARHRFLRTARYQLNYRPTVDGARLELYDLAADPDLDRNLVDARPDVAHALRARLLQWALGDPDLTLRDGRLATRDPAALARCAPRG